MGLSRGFRIAGVAALLALSLGTLGCGGSGGSGVDGTQFSTRSGFLGNGGGLGGNNGFDPDFNGGGPRNPGPGTGVPVPFNPSAGQGTIFISSGNDGVSGPNLRALNAGTFGEINRDVLTGNPRNCIYASSIDKILIADDDVNPNLQIKDLVDGTVTDVPYGALGGDDVAHDPNQSRIFVGSPNNLEAYEDFSPFLATPESGGFGSPADEMDVDSAGFLYATTGNGTFHVFSPGDVANALFFVDYAPSETSGDLVVSSTTLYVSTDNTVEDDIYAYTLQTLNATATPIASRSDLGGGIVSIAVDEGRNLVYAICEQDNQMHILNADTLLDAPTTPVVSTGDQPIRVVYESVNDQVYVLCSGTPPVLNVYDAQSLTQVSGSPVDLTDEGDPHGVTVVPPSTSTGP